MNPKIKPIAAAVALATFTSLPVNAAEKELDPIVVTATRQNQKLTEAVFDVDIIQQEDIQNSTAQTLGELLGRQAGVQFNRSGGPGAGESLYVRGAGSNQTLILVDGVRVGSATLGTTALELVPLNQISRVEILKGPASAIYGSDAIGGVVNIITDSTKPGTELSAGFGSQNSFMTTVVKSMKADDVNVYIRAGASGTEGINSITNPSSKYYNPDRDGFQNNNISVGARYAPRQDFSLGAYYLNTTSFSRNDNGYYNPTDYSTTRANLSYGALHQIEKTSLVGHLDITDIWRTTATLARGIDSSKTNLPTTAGSPPQKFSTIQDQASLQNDVRLPLGTALILLETLDQKIGGTQTYAEKSRQINSLALGWHGDIGNSSLQANTRSDQNSQFGTHDTHSLGYGYKLSPALQVGATTGTSFRAPTFNDLYYPNDGYGEGNKDLKPETAKSNELFVRFYGENLDAKLTYYTRDVTNMIAWAPTADPYFWTPSNIGKAKVDGWETQVSTKLLSWDLSAALNVQNPVAKSDSPDGSLLAGDQLRRQPKQFGAIRASRRFGDMNLALEMVGRDTTYEYGTQGWPSKQVVMPMGGYTVVNLHADMNVTRDTKAFVNLGNLFDRKYEMAKSTTTTFGTLGATVFVGLRYTPQ